MRVSKTPEEGSTPSTPAKKSKQKVLVFFIKKETERIEKEGVEPYGFEPVGRTATKVAPGFV